MPVILLLFGAILAVAAFNDAQSNLATELETDFPPFIKWLLAVGAIGGIGFIPGMQTISRWLLALVFLVVFLKNYTAILAGFQALGSGTASLSQASPTPAQAYIANPNNPQITQANATGAPASGNINAVAQTPQVPASHFGAFDPGNYLAAFEAGFGGFGGVV